MNALRIEGLGIRHDGRAVLRDVCLEVAEGESLCLIGASGGGKSLIAAAVAGLLPGCMEATGWIGLGPHRLRAADQRGLRALWHSRTCLLPQEPAQALAPLLPALSQLRLTPPWLDRAGALGWLARLGLDAGAAARLPFQLSGGMAQRLLAALVLRGQAPLLLADEPTKGLDPARRAELLALFATLRAAGRALLLITHDLAVPQALGGRIAVLEEGRIAECGLAGSVLAAPRSAFARACVAADPRLWPARSPAAGGEEVARAEALAIGRGGRALAGPLDFSLHAGRMTALLGPSGIGKTTLGDTLLALAPPAAGRLCWLGRPLDTRLRQSLRTRFQKLHQDPTRVFPRQRPLGESLADLARLRPGTAPALPPLLERLGISPALLRRPPEAVSGGEAQRVALARLLALRPALLVADEPCSRLDPPTRRAALHLLRGLADEEGLGVLLITHDAAAARALADATLSLGPPGGGMAGEG